tara:strand:+ start:160 stop:834 length:675 start_codon:yes stop_codon:yes gene_type:complete
MNFFNNKIGGKDYVKILKKYEKNFSKEFVIKNYGAFMGSKSFYKFLVCFELLKKVKKIKGDVVEFGVWNGNNLFVLKKILDFLGIKKKIIGYDHFKGMPIADNNNYFKGDKKFISYISNFYKLSNIKIIDDDILNIKFHKKSFSKLSFIYIDCDLYKTTNIILDELSEKLSTGGIIVFDEGNITKKSGESKALNEFFSKNKNKYKKIIMKKFYQPDVFLEKIKK